MVLATRDDAAIESAAETLKFLSDRNRLRIVTRLARAETCVCDLIDELDLPQPLVSYHLAKLRKAGLRPVQIWVPDTRSATFAKECRRQSLLLKGDKAEREALAFIEAAAERGEP